VPSGGFSDDEQHWIHCKEGFFLPVRFLSRLFRRLFIEKLCVAYAAGELQFFGQHKTLNEPKTLEQWWRPLK
tara:strand:+ start:1829 stop:2044 length:216 start_codon:yes stop_codon:yes gene_type:complete